VLLAQREDVLQRCRRLWRTRDGLRESAGADLPAGLRALRGSLQSAV
jgi:hypothetical protein